MTKPRPAIKPLPAEFAARYRAWHSGDHQAERALYADLAARGQHPSAMVISCCDSRVHPMAILGGRVGDFFIHRNIANLIPPPDEGDATQSTGAALGTGAALEYAVEVLRVRHIIVMGHSGCGGIEGGYHRLRGTGERSLEETQFIGNWLDLLRPAFDALGSDGDADKRSVSDADGGGAPDTVHIAALEKQSVVTGLENLLRYSFVAEACGKGRLSLHGLWHDIASGKLLALNPVSGVFEAV